MEDTKSCQIIQLTKGSLIDEYHNEPSLWNNQRNASEDEKELAWAKPSMVFGTSAGTTCVNQHLLLKLICLNQGFSYFCLGILSLVNCKRN